MDYHFVILDSVSRKGRETGKISNQEFLWLREDLDNNQDKKIMMFIHHPCSSKDIPFVMAVNLFDALRLRLIIRRYNVVGVFSGHTHRNKVTRSFITKSVPYIETASSHKYPAGYNIYKVYANGYMQSFYKINSGITENKRHGEKEDLLSPLCGRFGFIWDRNFVIEY
jgi:3',5'-cyclic AMP phosphodiesterase CpdA